MNRFWSRTRGTAPGTAPLPDSRPDGGARPAGPRRYWRGLARAAIPAACIISVGLLALSPPSQARSGKTAATNAKLEEVERERKVLEARGAKLKQQKERLEKETEATQKRMVKVAAEARKREAAIQEIQTRLGDIRAEEKKRVAGLKTRRMRLKELLAALERIARHPPEALLAYTRTPQDTLRGAILLRAAIPKLEAEARELKESLQALAELRTQASTRAKALGRERAALAKKRQELATLVDKKKSLARSTDKELKTALRRQTELARKAKTLRELLVSIERARKARAAREAERAARADRARTRREMAEQTPPDRQAHLTLRPPGNLPSSIAKARGKLVRPVLGHVTIGFGDTSPTGGTAKGAYFAASEGAQVVAPFGGEVVFAGPFRGYGLLLIIDHGEGYHSLLAGLGRIDAVVGQRLLAGEPVGIMARTNGNPPRLYMELRHRSRPINPLPWLAAPSTIEANTR